MKGPSSREELENDRLATEGYVVPVGGQPVAATPAQPIVSVSAPAPIAPDSEAAPESFIVKGSRESTPVACQRCGATWWMQAHLIVTGPRKAERMPGVSPVWICANCRTVHQESAPNHFEVLCFENGRLTPG